MGAFPGAHLTKTRAAVVLPTRTYHEHRPDVVVGVITTQTPADGRTDCELLDWQQDRELVRMCVKVGLAGE